VPFFTFQYLTLTVRKICWKSSKP